MVAEQPSGPTPPLDAPAIVFRAALGAQGGPSLFRPKVPC